jgi:hypothetical protein
MNTKHIFIFLLATVLNVATFASDPGPLTQSQETIYWKAVRHFQEEDYQMALLLFQNLLDSNAENIELNYYAGMCYYNLNKLKLAKWHFSFAASDNCTRLKIILLARDSGKEKDLISYNQ